MKRIQIIQYEDNDLMFYSDKLAKKHVYLYGNCIVVNVNTINYIADPSSTIISHELSDKHKVKIMSS